METESQSLVETKSQENKKLNQKLIALERDYKIFQNSEKGLRPRQISIKGSNSFARIFENSPRTLMSSLQNRGSPVERENEEEIGFKGRSLLGDFEDAVEICGLYDDDQFGDRWSGKKGISDGSCSASCLSDEKLGDWMSEKVEREKCKRGLAFNYLVVVGLISIVLGFIYMMGFDVLGDGEVKLPPT